MKKFLIAASAALVLVTSYSAASAQCGCQGGCSPYQASLAHQYRSAYDANVQWPRIFIPAARSSVCSTYDAMVNNGWRRQNLLGNYHFDARTNELTDAGKLKVNWILSQAPMQRRNVFVQRGGEEVQTTARIAAVHDYSAQLAHGTAPMSVNDTHIVAEGHSAGSVDNVFTGYQANRLPPVLPAATSSASSGQ